MLRQRGVPCFTYVGRGKRVLVLEMQTAPVINLAQQGDRMKRAEEETQS